MSLTVVHPLGITLAESSICAETRDMLAHAVLDTSQQSLIQILDGMPFAYLAIARRKALELVTNPSQHYGI